MSIQLMRRIETPAPVPPAATIGTPLLYQPYFSEAQRHDLSPACAHLDASFNTGTTAREFELFEHLNAKQTAAGFPADRFWGLVSSKFDQKSPVPITEFLKQAEAAQAAGYDGYVLNPMIGNAAIYANVWEQGVACGHRGMAEVQTFLHQRGYPVGILQGAESFAFCNYMCGNTRFWANYFHLLNTIIAELEAEAERGSAIGSIYSGGASYQRDRTATMRPFILERLLTSYLTIAPLSGAIKIATYRASRDDFDYKFGPRIASRLYPLYDLKDRAVASGDDTLARAWFTERAPIVSQAAVLIWNLDDPPGWLPIDHGAR